MNKSYLQNAVKSWEGLLALVLIVVVIGNAIISPFYLDFGNIANIFHLSIEKAFVVFIMAFVIINAEILERTKVTPINCFGEADLSSDNTAKISQDISSVMALWCSCESQQYRGGKVLDNSAVTTGGDVVYFIDNDIVVII